MVITPCGFGQTKVFMMHCIISVWEIILSGIQTESVIHEVSKMTIKEKTRWYLGIFGFVALIWQLIFFFINPDNLFFLLVYDSHFIGSSYIPLLFIALPWPFFGFWLSSEFTSVNKRRAKYTYIIAFLLFTLAIYGGLLFVMPRYGFMLALYSAAVAILDAVVLVSVAFASRYTDIRKQSRKTLKG